MNEAGFVARVAEAAADASVVIAFGQKLGEPLLAEMGRLAVNLHGSLLPAWRGAAPVQRSVMAGERRTGVSVIGLAQRMDAGAVYGTDALEVAPSETAGGVHDRLAALGPGVVAGVLDRLAAGTLEPTEQDEAAATHAAKLRKADGTVGFDAPRGRGGGGRQRPEPLAGVPGGGDRAGGRARRGAAAAAGRAGRRTRVGRPRGGPRGRGGRHRRRRRPAPRGAGAGQARGGGRGLRPRRGGLRPGTRLDALGG